LRDFKLPITIIALIIPTSALISTIHRSVQTKVRIEQSEKQLQNQINSYNFTNYYKHREEFRKIFSLDERIRSKGVDLLYRCFYPKSRLGVYLVDEQQIHDIEVLLLEMCRYIFEDPNIEKSIKSIINNICDIYINLPIDLNVNRSSSNLADICYNNFKNSKTLSRNIHGCIANLDEIYYYIEMATEKVMDVFNFENRVLNENSIIAFMHSSTFKRAMAKEQTNYIFTIDNELYDEWSKYCNYYMENGIQLNLIL